MLRRNFLLPCVKATGWTTTSSGRKKRIYDAPQTPYQRLLATGTLDPDTASRLATIHDNLNPAKITRQITTLQTQLIAAAKNRTTNTRPDHPDISLEASAHTIRTS
jgi:hypothetical protein